MTQLHPPLEFYSNLPDRGNSRLSENMKFRSLNPSNAPSPNTLGPNAQYGSGLATEIDSYRRRIQTLLHFFDCIAQHWWDQLYPFKNNLIKRPSKSADEVRFYRSRLLTRLNKFTMRLVVPATAAIATMEAHASVKVLPLSLLNPMPSEVGEVPPSVENGDGLLRKAYTLARRLGDIEKLKQKLILSALTWITSDGRDFVLRAQRIAMLVRHAEPCLIEHYEGVRALLTHYYRPRVLSGTPSASSSSKLHTPRAEPITADRLTRTNEQIVQAVRSVCARVHQHWAITPAVGLDVNTERVSPSSRLGFWNESRVKSPEEEKRGEPQNLIDYDAGDSNVQSNAPLLPSVVLNPLSVDTSLLDWLSYEVNQRNFNLHVLNMEEPEEFVFRETPGPTVPSTRKLSSTKDEYSTVLPIDPAHLQARLSSLPSVPGDLKIGADAQRPLLTPIAVSEAKDSQLSDESNELDVSEMDEVRVQVKHVLDVQLKPVVDEPISEKPTLIESLIPDSELLNLDTVLPRYTRGPESGMEKSEITSSSIIDLASRSRAVVSPGGEGEGPTRNVLTVDTKLPLAREYIKTRSSGHLAKPLGTRRPMASKVASTIPLPDGLNKNQSARRTKKNKERVKPWSNHVCR